jgi:hypothetical protein
VDGTYIPLAYRPSRHGKDYFCRKKFYSLTAFIISDHYERIQYIYVGFPGFVHDSRIFFNSKLWLNSSYFFQEQEYLLPDSAFPVSTKTMCPYKQPQSLQPRTTTFNTCLASIRAKVEHCIGMLKGRFQSLRGLQV